MNRDLSLHGGALDLMKQHFPHAQRPWLDLSTGINPWPYIPRAVPYETMCQLPTKSQYSKCRDAMASAFGVRKEHLLLAPGSELLIRLLPTILKARHVCVMERSYSDYATAWHNAGCEISTLADPLRPSADCDVLVVCNPNNPDGRSWSRERLLALHESISAWRGTLVVDEAYADLAPDNSLIAECGKAGLIVLRSFGKFFGLAGVRLGAMAADRATLDAMGERLGVWPLPGPTLEVGASAYEDLQWQMDTRVRLEQQRDSMDTLLRYHAWKVVGGTNLFRLVWVSDADRVWRELAGLGIYVRKFDWCDHSLRLGLPSTDAARERLKDALKVINP